MNIERAFHRRAQLVERLARIEATGSAFPYGIKALAGQCGRHGEFIGVRCPVCAGVRKSSGRVVGGGGGEWTREVDHCLRARPRSGPFDGDPDASPYQ